MLFIYDTSTDPFWNLAAEEYLMDSRQESVCRIWRNAPSIIIGHNQNAYAEVNHEYLQQNHIPLVRRLSGGGAVFHDLGNLNYTFIENVATNEDTATMFRRFTAPVIEALRGIGVNAELQGRNDLTIEGMKISGNAIYKSRDRVLQHGTLLFRSSMDALASALKNRPEKYADKSVKSNRSRVTNVADHLPLQLRGMRIEEFMQTIGDSLAKDTVQYGYSDDDTKAIDALVAAKYGRDEWNWGHSPSFNFSKTVKYPCGLIEIYMMVAHGCIKNLEIKGDYFFLRPTEEFCDAMTGTRLTKNEIAERIGQIAFGDYFCGIKQEELAALFF
ncbi:MAG: lipoate--protein ligase [Bacteroidales bacterium]|nr:lipoate--protein ligase [Bacteroidales bacterium]